LLPQIAVSVARQSSLGNEGQAKASGDPQSDVADGAGNQAKGMTLPFSPVTLAFQDIYYTITMKDGQIVDLLQGVTGYANPSTMTALMGR